MEERELLRRLRRGDPSALEELMAGGTPHRFGDIDHTEEDGARIPATPSYTAYLKIAEGCDHRCAFCIIPKLRGRYRSRTMESLLAEAKTLADAGVKELIVIAQDITRYGTDLYGRRRLGDLLHRDILKALLVEQLQRYVLDTTTHFQGLFFPGGKLLFHRDVRTPSVNGFFYHNKFWAAGQGMNAPENNKFGNFEKRG